MLMFLCSCCSFFSAEGMIKSHQLEEIINCDCKFVDSQTMHVYTYFKESLDLKSHENDEDSLHQNWGKNSEHNSTILEETESSLSSSGLFLNRR